MAYCAVRKCENFEIFNVAYLCDYVLKFCIELLRFQRWEILLLI